MSGVDTCESEQLCLLSEPSSDPVYSTRFQGSKRRVLPWLLTHLKPYAPPDSRVLDGFTGSGVVCYGLARAGCRVLACDTLLSSFWTIDGLAVQGVKVPASAIDDVVSAAATASVTDLLPAYGGVFYPDEELVWLSAAGGAIRSQPPKLQGVLFWALFQSALAKRPYNLFHRANLDMRLRDVPRSFGNKKTWETPFERHFRKFVAEANRFVLPSASAAAVTCDVSLVEPDFDVVYLDPPYINKRGVPTPYTDFYGFLDILSSPSLLSEIDMNKSHRPLRGQRTTWEHPKTIMAGFRELFSRHAGASIVVSYRTGGIPPVEDIVAELRRHKRSVRTEATPIKYALSKSTADHEVLIIGE